MSIFPRCAPRALHTLTDLPSVAFSLILHTYAMWYRQVIVLCFVFFSQALALLGSLVCFTCFSSDYYIDFVKEGERGERGCSVSRILVSQIRAIIEAEITGGGARHRCSLIQPTHGSGT